MEKKEMWCRIHENLFLLTEGQSKIVGRQMETTRWLLFRLIVAPCVDNLYDFSDCGQSQWVSQRRKWTRPRKNGRKECGDTVQKDAKKHTNKPKHVNKKDEWVKKK